MVSPPAVVATILIFAALLASAKSPPSTPATTGNRKADPIELRSVFGANASTDPFVATTPLAPAASAVLTIVPKLPGSCAESRQTRSGATPSRALQARDGVAPLLVCLDSAQDPGNFGTIVRTAEAAGASGVVATKGSVDAFAPKTLRSSMGSAFRLPVVAGA